MSTTAERNASQRRQALRKAYAEQLPKRVGQIEAMAQDVVRDKASEESLRALKLAVRSLAGSSEALDLVGFTDAARGFEFFLDSQGSDLDIESPDIEQRLNRYLRTLKKACLELGRGELLEPLKPKGGDELAPERASRVLYFLSTNDAVAQELGFELGCFGFALRWFRDPEKLRRALEQAVPAAVMIDAEPFAIGVRQARRIDELREHEGLSTALLILSSRSDLESRLEAVRAGSDDYYVHPIETQKLIERLDRSARHSGSDPYRVLIVPQDYGSGLDHALTLQRAGMSIMMVHQPLKIWKELVDFQPEAILMDLDLQEIGGHHLGAVIRQQDAYVNTPIVFLSSDAGLDSQLKALRAEADDLLSVAVDADHLVSTLSHHVQRARARREFVGTDSLTGLLTHSAFVRRLRVEIDRTLRTSHDLAYAILDIDHLNSINETFGHLSGDSVLINLARLLVRRLRRADVVGRWGGDEFSVLMPETDGGNAQRVLEHVREMFAGLPHRSGDREFSPTFSCGLVTLEKTGTAETIHQRARTMLKSARIQGRNRIVLGS